MSSLRPRSAAMRKPKDPGGNRDRIIAAAAQEFAAHGLKGASMDAIAERTDTARGMINYYFGNKEDLYLEVLESAYRVNRQAEEALQLDALEPTQALQKLVEFTFDYYRSHPENVRLIAAENQAGGSHLKRSAVVKSVNQSILARIGQLLHRGARQKLFRKDCTPVELHMMITALTFFSSANKHTFGHSFDVDFDAPEVIARHRGLIVDAVLRFVLRDGATPVPRL